MLKKENYSLNLVDESIVKEDYIITSGTTAGHPFSEESKINEREIFGDYLGIFKINKPMLIRGFMGSSGVFVEHKKEEEDNRMPGEIYRDKECYDLAMFFLYPSNVNPNEKSHWKKLSTIDDAFVTDKGKGQASLLYLDWGWTLYENSIAVPIIPSQIPNYLFINFLKKEHRVISHDRTFEQKLEGTIQIPIEKARELTFLVRDILKERFDIPFPERRK